MKVLMTANEALSIQTIHFETGKETPFRLSTLVNIYPGYLWGIFILLILVTNTDLSQIRIFWESSLVNRLVYIFGFLVFIIKAIDDFFIKVVNYRESNTFQIDKNGYFSCPSEKIGMMGNVNLVDELNIVKKVEIIVSMRRHPDDDGFQKFAPITTYEVVAVLSSGKSVILENNSINLFHGDDNQVAFRELLAETQAAVEEINIFLNSCSMMS
jgi:hypothetical protein